MKKIISSMFLVLVAVIVISTFSLAGCATAATDTTAAAAETTAAAAEEPAETTAAAAETTSGEPVKLVIWWWGEQEAPGLEGYMKESTDMYTAAHPNVTFDLVLQSTESLVEAFRAAGAAGEGPDIQYFWGGIYTIEDAWNDFIVPISDYLPAEEIDHIFTKNEQMMDGKVWGLPWYMVPMVFGYNKDIYTAAGLDPESPPKTWTQLMSDCEAIKTAGYSPFILGNQEGIQGGWMQGWLGGQWFGGKTPRDIMAASLGKASYTDPKYATWWDYFGELRDKEYLNDDYESIQLYQGMEDFMAGKGAYSFGVLSSATSWVNTMGADKVGFMSAPVVEEAGGGWATEDMIDVSSQTLGITKWSENKEVAADFLAFLHTSERLNEMYLQSGAPPCDDRFDTNLLKTEQEKWAFEQVQTGNWFYHGENYIPVKVNVDGNYIVAQQFMDENLTSAEAASRVEAVAKLFRDQEPERVEQMVAWYDSFGEIFGEE
ncbi:MAG: ABC transporter substrate-binding protein [Candidatus Humimicrobiaceae bacterium]